MALQSASSKRRRIGDSTHNVFVAEGVAQHKPTRIVPPSFLEPFSTDLADRIAETQRRTKELLTDSVGEPFYMQDGFILYCGDSCELMPRLSDAGLRVELTLTSPPYNIGKEYEQCVTADRYLEWSSRWMNQVYALTSAAGSFWLNVGYFEVPDRGLCVPIAYLLWDNTPFYLLQEVVWQYGAGVSAKTRFSPRNEKWLYYVRDRRRYTFNLDAVRDPNVKYPNQKKNGKYRCNPLGKNPGDVWEFPKVTTGTNRSSRERTGHPAQFPLAVVERIIKASSHPGDLILDPFAGSCSAGIASAGLGRVFLGFELRPEYCELAVERYRSFRELREASLSQGTLF